MADGIEWLVEDQRGLRNRTPADVVRCEHGKGDRELHSYEIKCYVRGMKQPLEEEYATRLDDAETEKSFDLRVSEEKKPSWTVCCIAACMSALPLLYALSAGPFLWLAIHGKLPSSLESLPIYAPLQWADDSSAHFSAIFRWYLSLWGV